LPGPPESDDCEFPVELEALELLDWDCRADMRLSRNCLKALATSDVELDELEPELDVVSEELPPDAAVALEPDPVVDTPLAARAWRMACMKPPPGERPDDAHEDAPDASCEFEAPLAPWAEAFSSSSRRFEVSHCVVV
jgi:hypothetical protein